jgi:diguanylate cyclase (GGDEF)-like protein
MAAVLAASVRSHIDGVARFGGEEFALVLPESALDVTRRVAERLRTAVEKAEVGFEGRFIRVTASFGAAVVEPPWPSNLTADDLLSSADRCLYQAKEAGRNQAVVRSFSGTDPQAQAAVQR